MGVLPAALLSSLSLPLSGPFAGGTLWRSLVVVVVVIQYAPEAPDYAASVSNLPRVV